MTDTTHQSLSQLENGLDEIRRSPIDLGDVRLIVRRPRVGEREVVAEAELNFECGLVGDSWLERARSSKHDAATSLEMQLTIMNARVISLIAQTPDRWTLAGDQFYVDLDLSQTNLPAGARLEIGSALVEVSAVPHTGCKLFAARYGTDAVKFVNSPWGKQLRLRGLNAKVVRPGTVHAGDAVRKVSG